MSFVGYPPRPRPFFIPRNVPWTEATDGKGRKVPMWFDSEDNTVFVYDPDDPNGPWEWDPQVDWLNSDGQHNLDVLSHDLERQVESFYNQVK